MEIVKDVNLILKMRTVSAVFSAVLLQLIVFAVYSAITFADFYDPLSWLYHFFMTLVSPRSWLYFLPVFLTMLFVGFTTLAKMSDNFKFPMSRYEAIKGAFSARSIVHIVAYILLAATIPLTYLFITERSLLHPCQDRKQLSCLNVSNIFVVSCAFWTGLIHIFKNNLGWKRVLLFPVIREVAFLKLRSNFVEILGGSLRNTFMPVLYYLPVFYFSGSIIGNFFSFVSGAHRVNEESLYSLGLFIHAWLLSAVVYTSLKLLSLSLELYIIKHLSLPVPNLIALLKDAQTPLLQELGFQDLSLLSSGRGDYDLCEVFALSQPGGFPYNWNVIQRQCLHVITSFQHELDTAHSGVKKSSLDTKLDSGENLSTRKFPLGIRSLTERAWYEGREDASNFRVRQQPWQTNDSWRQETWRGVMSHDKPNVPSASLLMSALDAIKKVQLIQYMFSPVNELFISALLENSQMVIWAIDSLAKLSSRAYTEDRFGVVVDDLPAVITTLVEVKISLQQVKRKQKNTDRAGRMRASMFDTLTRSLILLASIYSEHIHNLPLKPHVLEAINSFAVYSDS